QICAQVCAMLGRQINILWQAVRTVVNSRSNWNGQQKASTACSYLDSDGESAQRGTAVRFNGFCRSVCRTVRQFECGGSTVLPPRPTATFARPSATARTLNYSLRREGNKAVP